MKRPKLKPKDADESGENRPEHTKTKSTSRPKPARDSLRPKPARDSSTLSPDRHGSFRETTRTAPRQESNSTFIARLLTLGVVALAVFLVVFSPLTSWMEQQQQARDLAAQIAKTKAANEELEEEIARYNDPDFISRQARERLGYVKPGETTYVVIDPPGKEKPQPTKGWLEKDTDDLPWFGLIVSGLQVAGGTSK